MVHDIRLIAQLILVETFIHPLGHCKQLVAHGVHEDGVLSQKKIIERRFTVVKENYPLFLFSN